MTPFVFDIKDFRASHPQFCGLGDTVIESLFDTVSVLIGDGKGNFPYPEEKAKPIIYAALCHLCTLQTNGINQPGRVASASEGSVSTSFENIQVKSETGQWWSLTQCGALYWILSRPYRAQCRVYLGGRRYHPFG